MMGYPINSIKGIVTHVLSHSSTSYTPKTGWNCSFLESNPIFLHVLNPQKGIPRFPNPWRFWGSSSKPRHPVGSKGKSLDLSGPAIGRGLGAATSYPLGHWVIQREYHGNIMRIHGMGSLLHDFRSRWHHFFEYHSATEQGVMNAGLSLLDFKGNCRKRTLLLITVLNLLVGVATVESQQQLKFLVKMFWGEILGRHWRCTLQQNIGTWADSRRHVSILCPQPGPCSGTTMKRKDGCNLVYMFWKHVRLF